MPSTEALTCSEPKALLQALLRRSDRKVRLFVCACARHVWPWLPRPASRHAIETAERYADGAVSSDLLTDAYWAVRADAATPGPARLAAWAAAPDTWPAARRLLYSAAWDGERGAQLALARDLLGDPGRPAAVDRAWLRRNDGAAARVARAVYDGRCFDDMPVLADALEDAGCDDAGVLEHCRGGGVHARGCWVLDALLGRR
jgi:hypothetical protein